MGARPIRVLIVDDHEAVRRGVGALLEAAGDMAVCGEAAATTEASEVAEATEPDVAVVDLCLGGDSGIEACRDIRSRRPGTQVVMLTSAGEEEAVVASVMAGASGYLVKQLCGPDIVAAVRAVAQGRRLLPAAVTTAIVEGLLAPPTGASATGTPLSSEDKELLLLVAEGRTNREIAEERDLDENVVKEQLAATFSRLDAARRERGERGAGPRRGRLGR